MGTAEEALEAYLGLEAVIDQSLRAVIGDTESSAHAIIRHIRGLHDAATTLVTYLDGTSLKAGDLGEEIVQSVTFLGDIAAFIERLPVKIQTDLENVRAVVHEIKTLGEMTSDVQAISLQSHLLAVNASIEASRAGASGAAFKVVAEEMRKLASNSSLMAAKMNQGLVRARGIVESGMESTIADSSRQLADVTKATTTIHKLREHFEDMSQYYKTRFAIVTKHNEDLARDIAEVLGHIQYQDVVRQSIERVLDACDRRNAALRECLDIARDDPPAARHELTQQLELIVGDYLTEDSKHVHSARSVGAGAPPKLELF